MSGVTVMAADFTTALESLQEAHSQDIGAPKVGLLYQTHTAKAQSSDGLLSTVD